MNTTFWTELSDDSAENISGGYYFGPSSETSVYANISENLNINKSFKSLTAIVGNFAGAEASATAIGPNTATQGISETNVVAGVGSTSHATSLSGTSLNSVKWY